MRFSYSGVLERHKQVMQMQTILSRGPRLERSERLNSENPPPSLLSFPAKLNTPILLPRSRGDQPRRNFRLGSSEEEPSEVGVVAEGRRGTPWDTVMHGVLSGRTGVGALPVFDGIPQSGPFPAVSHGLDLQVSIYSPFILFFQWHIVSLIHCTSVLKAQSIIAKYY